MAIDKSFFPPSPNTINYNFSDVVRGNSYITLHCIEAIPKATIYESYTSDDSTKNNANAVNWTAQTFTVGNTGTDEEFYVHGCEIKIAHNATSLEDIWIEIQETTTNEPNGTVIARAHLDEFQGVGDTSLNWTRFSFAGSPKLSAATQYALVIYRDGGSNNLSLRYDSSSSYGGGAKWDSGDSGSTWIEDSGTDLAFKILGDTTPTLTFFSENIASTTNATYQDPNPSSTAYTEIFDQDIDVILGRSAIVQGTCIVSLKFTATTAIETWSNFYFFLDLIKDDGTTTTSLGTSETKAVNYRDSDDGENYTSLGQINIANNVKFKKNDVFRLNIKLYHKTETTTSNTTFITIPWNDIFINIPFKVDI